MEQRNVAMKQLACLPLSEQQNSLSDGGGNIWVAITVSANPARYLERAPFASWRIDTVLLTKGL